jgi:hypothetical protein
MTNGHVTKAQLVTSREEIRARRKGTPYTLPGSGISVPLKRPNLLAMATGVGKIPNPLDDQVLTFLSRNRDTDLFDDLPDGTESALEQQVKAKQREDKQKQRYLDNAQIFMKLFRLCVQEPISDEVEPEGDMLSIHDFADQDFIWMYYVYVEGQAVEADKFLTERVLAERGGTDKAGYSSYAGSTRDGGLSEQAVWQDAASNPSGELN